MVFEGVVSTTARTQHGLLLLIMFIVSISGLKGVGYAGGTL